MEQSNDELKHYTSDVIHQRQETVTYVGVELSFRLLTLLRKNKRGKLNVKYVRKKEYDVLSSKLNRKRDR